MTTRLPEDELRQASCRALNDHLAEITAPHRDRMTVAATIPTFTPEEAIAELDHAVESLVWGRS